MSSSKSSQQLALAALVSIPFAWLAYRRYTRVLAQAAPAAPANTDAAATAAAAAAAADTKSGSAVAVNVQKFEALAAANAPNALNANAPAEPVAASYYFGYGSNMSTRTMNRRNIHPASSEPAILHGYRLAMNLKSSLAPLEPSFANVEPETGRTVHGILHRVTAAAIEQLTREEGGGESYVRMELPVVTYGGKTVTAYVFVLPKERAHMKYAEGDVPCSKRYIGLLLHGAKEMKLAPEYVQFLESLPTAPMPQLADVLTAERKAQIEARAVTLEEVKDTGKGYLWTAVKGVVLDLTENKSFVRRVFGGQEKTLDMAKFLCDPECPLPTELAQLNARHKAFIDAALATIMSLHPIVGHVKGQSFDW